MVTIPSMFVKKGDFKIGSMLSVEYKNKSVRFKSMERKKRSLLGMVGVLAVPNFNLQDAVDFIKQRDHAI